MTDIELEATFSRIADRAPRRPDRPEPKKRKDGQPKKRGGGKTLMLCEHGKRKWYVHGRPRPCPQCWSAYQAQHRLGKQLADGRRSFPEDERSA